MRGDRPGHANLLLCRVSAKLVFHMTDEKTAQLVGNIEVVDGTLTSNTQSDCAWVWRATHDQAADVLPKAIAQGLKEAFAGWQVLAQGTRDTASPGHAVTHADESQRLP